MTGEFDIVISGGHVFDGDGGPPRRADVAISGDRIAAVRPGIAKGARVVDAGGLAVAPGFINMMSWATDSLVHDGRSLSDLRQGVTLEVFGEASMGPLSPSMKREMREKQRDVVYDIEWSTLREYLDFVERRGVTPNIASFVGAGTVREFVIGNDDRPPTRNELDQMVSLVQRAMNDGALGLASALIYPPGVYSTTEELIELARAVAPFEGLYISHVRSETDRVLEGIGELITIARAARIRAEIYHFKIAGRRNWHLLRPAIDLVEAARRDGTRISADMYPYTAARSGLDAVMPPWVKEGGEAAWIERLRSPELRARVRTEMSSSDTSWENFFTAAGGPEQILLVGFKNPDLKRYTGQTLAEVAAARDASAEDTAIDLVIEDRSRVSTVFFLMSDDNIREQIRLPWMTFCSDEASLAPEGPFLNSNPHPRGYGSFARLLGQYVRDEETIELGEAIRRLTSLPAANLRLESRGRIVEGNYADIVVFDPANVRDLATYAAPHQFATGVEHVFVNGDHVLRLGEHTGRFPGRVLRPR